MIAIEKRDLVNASAAVIVVIILPEESRTIWSKNSIGGI